MITDHFKITKYKTDNVAFISFFNLRNMKKILFLFSIALFLFSCRGTDDLVGLEKVSVFPSSSGGNNKLLKKIKIIETGAAAYDINYNWSSGKLMSITTSNAIYSYNLEYIGNQVSKITYVSTGASANFPAETRISNLIYSTSGVLTTISGNKLSSNNGNSSFSTAITYTANKPSMLNTTYSQGLLSSEIYNAEFGASNLNKITSTVVLIGISTNIVSTYFNYDNYKNPINTLPSAFNIATHVTNSTQGQLTGLSINNVRSVSVLVNGNTSTENIVYTYNIDGYPITSVTSNSIAQYEYISL
jgi:hypothetical protein